CALWVSVANPYLQNAEVEFFFLAGFLFVEGGRGVEGGEFQGGGCADAQKWGAIAGEQKACVGQVAAAIAERETVDRSLGQLGQQGPRAGETSGDELVDQADAVRQVIVERS